LLILGDPLCQPWAQIPTVSVSGVKEEALVSGTIEIEPAAELPAGRAVARYELYIDGVRRQQLDAGQRFALDTTEMADGFHELRVVATDDSPLETTGRWIGQVLVKNGRDAVSVTTQGAARVTAPQVTLTVASTVDVPTAVFHNGRPLGRVQGRQGTLVVPVEKLGKGPVIIEARTIGAPALQSRPLRLEVL
jgi:hypothetical protein